MRLASVVLLLVVAAVAAQKFTTKYDNVNLDNILKNERLFNKYVQCLLEPGEENCTADGKELKVAIPDALLNECSKCNERQKAGADKVIRFVIKNKRDVWQRLTAKYDPDGQYYNRYSHYLKA